MIYYFFVFRATKERDERLSLVTKWEDFIDALERRHILLAPFCGEIPCEDSIKNDSARYYLYIILIYYFLLINNL